MTKTQRKAARDARRARRAQRNQIAVKVTHHLLAPSLTPAQLKRALDAFAKLFPVKVEGDVTLTKPAAGAKKGGAK